MSQRLRKVVFPVAGLGTRFLPASKVVAKEMLPVLDKPLIQYAVDEAVDAGADTLIFVTNRYKHSIADYFDVAYELEQKLERAGKNELLAAVRNVIPKHVRCVFVTQSEALGLGHAVLCAQPAVGAEPFFVHLADDLIRSDVACLRQMADVYDEKKASVLGVQVVPRQDTDKYGIVAVEADESATSRVRSIVEKPKPAVAPSTLAVVGRYVLAPTIFGHLEKIGQGAGGEIQLTDGIAALMREEAVYAHRFTGKRYDCGSKLGYLQATVEYALGHAQLGREFRAYLQQLDLTGNGQDKPAGKLASSGNGKRDRKAPAGGKPHAGGKARTGGSRRATRSAARQ